MVGEDKKACDMSHRREFEIAFVGLKPGIHEYDYEIKDRFFEAFQQQDFRNCMANVKLSLDKKTGFIMLKFEIGGQGCGFQKQSIRLRLFHRV